MPPAVEVVVATVSPVEGAMALTDTPVSALDPSVTVPETVPGERASVSSIVAGLAAEATTSVAPDQSDVPCHQSADENRNRYVPSGTLVAANE